MTDWHDLTRRGVVTVTMVNPTDLDATMGELEGVDLSGSSLSYGYYADTRVTGKLRVVGDGWVRGSWLRIGYRIPEWDYQTELGTFIVTNDTASRERGAWTYELDLQSALYGLSTNLLVRPWAIARNAMALKAIRQCVTGGGGTIVTDGARDYRLKGAKVVETGTSRLSAVYALCDMANDRLDVDGHGRVVVAPYVVPASRAPSLTIDLADRRGVAQDGITRTTDWLQMPTVAAVQYTYDAGGKQREINASATVASTAHQSYANRGYVVTDLHQLSEMAPATAQRAQQLAKQFLANDATEHVEWEVTTTYLPIKAGDVVELVVHDGLEDYQGARKCLVKTCELELGTMAMKLTLKETASGDEED